MFEDEVVVGNPLGISSRAAGWVGICSKKQTTAAVLGSLAASSLLGA